jgi:hypothetical protein
LRAEDLLIDLKAGGKLTRELLFLSCQLVLTLHATELLNQASHFDLALVSLNAELPEQRVRYVGFKPSEDDPSPWSSTQLKITPGSYTALWRPFHSSAAGGIQDGRVFRCEPRELQPGERR